MENNLRQQIKYINENTKLSSSEKSRKIFELMNPQLKNKKEEITLNFNFDKNGCKHYKRKCLMKAECCNNFVPCRLCHDEICDHKINRFETKEMKCKLCEYIQPVNNKCINCNEIMGDYYCNICKFWSNDETTKIYHCDECGICRKGIKEDYYHCKICNSCIHKNHKDTHKCLEKSLDTDCPICNENLFNSTKAISLLQCGHYIHSECMEEYIKSSNYQCPICKKSLMNMDNYWNILDNFLKDQQMPEEYKNTYCLLYCNDCEKRNYSNYHFIYNKCKDCRGYNTNIIKVIQLKEIVIKQIIEKQRKIIAKQRTNNNCKNKEITISTK